MKLDVKSASGAGKGTVDAPDALFGIEPNVAVMHQVVNAQLAAARSGTHSTKTRAEVRGGGAKPWRQKGTGRARQGSIRSPQWRGGGIAHGPKPRDYRQRTPKKMIRLALCSALSDRAADGKVLVVDEWGIDEPRTKDAVEILGALGLRTKAERDERVLVVLDNTEEAVWRSFRNLGDRVQLVLPRELNAYDVLVSDWLVFSKATLDATVAHFGEREVNGTAPDEQAGDPE
ncbi:MAG TPA: 50S ribosomal protein L4 [Acidimicrobiia bacterium]|nr:50S ribosomal protein L4 [Acidimicrobiia bacterium]